MVNFYLEMPHVHHSCLLRDVTLLKIHSLLLWLGERDLSSDCVDVTTFTGEAQLPALSFVAISLQRPYVCACMHVCVMNAYVAVPNIIPSHILITLLHSKCCIAELWLGAGFIHTS